LSYTDVLGKLACIVCSKILGIGSAERAWGDAKQNTNDTRSHLSAEAIKMQLTLFGTYCAEKAQSKQQQSRLGLNRYGIDINEVVNNVPTRIFRAWLEPWEEEIMLDNHPVNQARFLEKYGAMV
jgi:hypothetical protein